VLSCLSNQQREELTSSAQMALRLLAFKQIYKILGMECLMQQNGGVGRVAKKRPIHGGSVEQVDEKRLKQEGEVVIADGVKVEAEEGSAGAEAAAGV